MVKAIKMVKDQRGLTLIELLAVIVILAIILAIAVPAIGSLISKTDDRATVSDAAQVIAAAKLYVAANGVPTSGEIPKGHLKNYLDNAEWDGDTGKVKVSSTGVYSIIGHSVNKLLKNNLATEVTEEDIQNELDKKDTGNTTNNNNGN
ncbi:prepilin-type N-terminal cleavage/methylation domain-containing protein [Alkalihalobacterium bogoriense]|uniref:prepilin-type N-terminal cleavage/methylation domain-containing protein n=1 Tax=Alkalihalobacterium bogoriense TaxID=246272 RepID=UPI0006869EBF|nr:prepilin-type N-terminal cleavage/methylation domain-containing protein [Alkalihalobacterium bogoriense]